MKPSHCAMNCQHFKQYTISKAKYDQMNRQGKTINEIFNEAKSNTVHLSSFFLRPLILIFSDKPTCKFFNQIFRPNNFDV